MESLEHEVRDALEVDPVIHGDQIDIAVADGVVTLTGYVESIREAVAAERAARRVAGVRAISNALHVKSRQERTDTDIAREALHRLRNTVTVPLTVQASVHDGWIRLTGAVQWGHQRDAAEHAVRCLSGVSGVTNEILVADR